MRSAPATTTPSALDVRDQDGRRICAAVPPDARPAGVKMCTLDHGHASDDHHIDWAVLHRMLRGGFSPGAVYRAAGVEP